MRAFVTFVVLAALVWLVLVPVAPPTPSSTDAFDVKRAFADLQVLAAAPRPPGTPAHDAARDYLLAQLRAAGWDAQVQETTWVRPEYVDFADGYPVRAVRVQNVVARRAGTATGEPAVLLAAHYDSKTTTPGVSDDGYGTAALLETARVLAAGAPLSRDVILAFTDGEELGLFGAAAFVGAHPWEKDVGVVLNFEARGNDGPALLFETSGPDLTLLEAAATAPHPMGNSLARAIYQRMPNDTDFSDWRKAGVPGLNFANIGGWSRYHAPADTLAHVSLPTLLHHGQSAVALVRRLAATPPNVPLVPDRGAAVYFDVAGVAFVVYPDAWSWWVTLAAAGLLVAWVALLARKDPLVPRKVFLAFGAQLGALVGAIVLSVGLLMLTRAIRPDALTPAARPSAVLVYLLAFLLLAVVAATLAARAFPRRVGVLEWAAAGGALWLVATVLLHRALPGGAYLLAWPLIGLALSGLAASLLPAQRPYLQLGVLLLGGVPALLLLPEHAFHIAQAFGVLGGPALTIVAALFLLPQAALVALLTPRAPYVTPITAGVVAALLYTTGAALPLYDAAHPRPGTLFAVYDADKREAAWLSPDDAPAPWVASRVDAARVARPDFFPLEPERTFRSRPLDATVSAALAESAPNATLVDTTPLPGGGRRVRLRLSAPADTVALGLYVGGSVKVTAATLDGAAITAFPTVGGLAVHYWGPPDAGSELTLDLPDATPLRLRLLAQHQGFPPGVTVERTSGDAAKPSMVLAPIQEFMDSDTTLTGRTLTF
jgi:hypothetical protein